MNKVIPDSIINITKLLKLHNCFANNEYNSDINFSLGVYKSVDDIPLLRNKNSIYMLFKNNYPVYVGKSIDASSRTKNHLKDKIFDKIIVSTADNTVNENKVLKYIEFLFYYTFWSQGYCLIYNSIDVWNALPIMTQKGPIFNKNHVSYSQLYVNSFLNKLAELQLTPPEESNIPIKLKYIGNKPIKLNIIYWRPTMREEFHQIAIDYWNEKNKSNKRCKFAGAGSFLIQQDTIGCVMSNSNDDQYTTYSALRKMQIFIEKGDKTIWGKPYFFPKSNLLLHVVQGRNSENARRELVLNDNLKTLESIETDWKNK